MARNRPIGRHDRHRLANSFKSGRVSSNCGIVILRGLFIVSPSRQQIGCETTTDDRDTERSMISNPFLQMVTILSCKNTALYASEGIAKFCWTVLITSKLHSRSAQCVLCTYETIADGQNRVDPRCPCQPVRVCGRNSSTKPHEVSNRDRKSVV